MKSSPFSSRLAFDAPVRFADGREYRVGDWSLRADEREKGEQRGLFVEAEVTRVDRPHPSSRYPAWGDTFSFVLRFTEADYDDEEVRVRALLFARLWICRHLRENAQPRSQSRHVVTIEGNFGE